MIIVGFLALGGLSFAMHWLEAMYGRARLRRYLARNGWTLRSLRWRPTWPLRQVRFHVEVERDGDRRSGTALLGGDWSGPVWSRRIEFELNDA